MSRDEHYYLPQHTTTIFTQVPLNSFDSVNEFTRIHEFMSEWVNKGLALTHE